MPGLRRRRRIYYNLFSNMYDAFVKLHARRDAGDTRRFLVEAAHPECESNPAILDVCCGTGAVIHAFADRYGDGLSVGYDFSRGMLRRARSRAGIRQVIFIEGDAATLPFKERSFDIVTCSHALYELKGPAREEALQEMKRVVRPTGVVLLMEHEVPRHPLIRLLFNLRMLTMGAADAREFVRGGLAPFARIFPDVSLAHSPSGKSKLILCRKGGEVQPKSS
jgi:ubiquinone/menaquinone biosynthesis C-methylase UbiE